jgi:hypothetical protein
MLVDTSPAEAVQCNRRDRRRHVAGRANTVSGVIVVERRTGVRCLDTAPKTIDLRAGSQ